VRGADLPFCQTCWNRVEIARRLRLVVFAFCAVSLLGGALLARATGSSVPFIVALCISLAAALVALARSQ
jgi:hypothetical protein